MEGVIVGVDGFKPSPWGNRCGVGWNRAKITYRLGTRERAKEQ
ncbi:hypothetical protein GCM10020220_035920 [Nonomuraea rubra]